MNVGVARLRAKLGRYMRMVRRGGEVVITDRGEAVARLVPISTASRNGEALGRPRDPTAPPLGQVKLRAVVVGGIDSIGLLREDRERR